jgi:hypothetical protein
MISSFSSSELTFLYLKARKSLKEGIFQGLLKVNLKIFLHEFMELDPLERKIIQKQSAASTTNAGNLKLVFRYYRERYKS